MLERFETSAEKAFFLSLCATVVLGVVVAVASVRTQIRVASPGFVVWQNLIVPAIGAIGLSPEATTPACGPDSCVAASSSPAAPAPYYGAGGAGGDDGGHGGGGGSGSGGPGRG